MNERKHGCVALVHLRGGVAGIPNHGRTGPRAAEGSPAIARQFGGSECSRTNRADFAPTQEKTLRQCHRAVDRVFSTLQRLYDRAGVPLHIAE